MKMTRKVFLAGTGAALLTALGCGGDDSKTTGDCLANGAEGGIQNNHGHKLTVAKEDVQTKGLKEYGIQGDADHDHKVVLGSTDFAALAEGKTVTTTSTGGRSNPSDAPHIHTVVISCV